MREMGGEEPKNEKKKNPTRTVCRNVSRNEHLRNLFPMPLLYVLR